ncbi:hypothetical protein PPERSA_02605 [Pseudocohnilembus persalinus]|uniref:Uncharacterized protein n=1 Tax=Pseudocohnilembus persalinus TaxID=266149 RepID=A0A0V0R686_PSEPJ|nr:hypothetical protein PPERSA_02605 [Pseudocohnilembus persalinus]|eukprot:KRX09733.1 hypothetical protein PPERSA_02605 [Pseudocohnilembus persalinus]
MNNNTYQKYNQLQGQQNLRKQSVDNGYFCENSSKNNFSNLIKSYNGNSQERNVDSVIKNERYSKNNNIKNGPKQYQQQGYLVSSFKNQNKNLDYQRQNDLNQIINNNQQQLQNSCKKNDNYNVSLNQSLNQSQQMSVQQRKKSLAKTGYDSEFMSTFLASKQNFQYHSTNKNFNSKNNIITNKYNENYKQNNQMKDQIILGDQDSVIFNNEKQVYNSGKQTSINSEIEGKKIKNKQNFRTQIQFYDESIVGSCQKKSQGFKNENIQNNKTIYDKWNSNNNFMQQDSSLTSTILTQKYNLKQNKQKNGKIDFSYHNYKSQFEQSNLNNTCTNNKNNNNIINDKKQNIAKNKQNTSQQIKKIDNLGIQNMSPNKSLIKSQIQNQSQSFQVGNQDQEIENRSNFKKGKKQQSLGNQTSFENIQINENVKQSYNFPVIQQKQLKEWQKLKQKQKYSQEQFLLVQEIKQVNISFEGQKKWKQKKKRNQLNLSNPKNYYGNKMIIKKA